jgi:hypothetical protein
MIAGSSGAVSEGLHPDSFSVDGLQIILPVGPEHTVYHSPATNTVMKITHAGSFGWSTRGEAERATPLEYLDRLARQN